MGNNDGGENGEKGLDSGHSLEAEEMGPFKQLDLGVWGSAGYGKAEIEDDPLDWGLTNW